MSRAQSCSEKYWHFINSCPLLVCLSVSLVSIIVSITGLSLHPPTLDANPEEAFKTWRTEISARLFTWRQIERDLTNSPQILVPSSLPPVKKTRRVRRRKRQSQDDWAYSDDEDWADQEDLLAANPGIPASMVGRCLIETMFPVFDFALGGRGPSASSGGDLPLRIAVFQAPKDQLPSHNATTGLCDKLALLKSTNYAMVSICSLIKACDLRSLGGLFERKMCNPGDTIEQLMEVIRHYLDPGSGSRETRGKDSLLSRQNGTLNELERFNSLVLCAVQKMFLSRQTLDPSAEYFYTAVYFNRSLEPDSALDFYDHVVGVSQKEELILKGYFTGEQGVMDVFERCMWTDMKISIPVTLLLVFILMFAYTGSIFYSGVVLTSAAFSFTIAYSLYFTVFKEFWFTNYLGAVILLGIGADDCFVLVHNLQQEELRRESSKKSRSTEGGATLNAHTNNNHHRPSLTGSSCCGLFQWQPVSPWMLRALKHAAITMFITSATTAAAFLCNIVTPVFGIKAFGFFSGCLVVVNYLMVITLVPSSLILKQRYLDNSCGGNYSRFSSLLKGLMNVSDRVQEYAFRKTIPRWIDKAKWFLSATLVLLVCSSCFIIFYSPGLSRAQNTTQLFHSHHEIQWFQDAMGEDFELTNPGNFEDVHVIWGVDFADTSAPNDADEGELQLWDNFKLTETFMRDQRELCKLMAIEGYQTGPEGCFADQCRTKWSSGEGLVSCLRSQTLRQKASADPLKRASSGPYWFRPEEGPLPTPGPPSLGNVKVYIQSFRKKFPSSLQLQRTCDAVAGLKKEVETVFREGLGSVDNATTFREGWVVASSRMAFRRLQSCDLQDTLQKNTAISVSIPIAIALLVVLTTTIISQLCVRPKGGPARFIRTVATGFVASFTCICIISCTVAAMALMHWKLNTVESVIIALAIGLSFDFTMHYAYAYVKQELTRDTQACLVNVFQIAGIPVLLSFASTFVAGFCFLFAKAFPLFQVGLFMIVVTGFSWAFGTFLFPAAMSTVDVIVCAFFGEPEKWESEPNSPVHALQPLNGAASGAKLGLAAETSSIGDGASIIVRSRLLEDAVSHSQMESASQGTGDRLTDGGSLAVLCDAASRAQLDEMNPAEGDENTAEEEENPAAQDEETPADPLLPQPPSAQPEDVESNGSS